MSVTIVIGHEPRGEVGVAALFWKNVTALLRLRDGETTPCQEVQSLIEDRLADTAQHLKDLQHVQKVFKASLKLCREAEDSGRCHVLDDLNDASSGHA